MSDVLLWVVIAAAAVAYVVFVGVALHRDFRLDLPGTGPERPLGWDAAMDELEPPELPVERYQLDALVEEVDASAAALERLTEWLRVEPRDDDARARRAAMLPRHNELRRELERRITGLKLQAEAGQPPGPHDDVVEMRSFGGPSVARYIVRCTCDECAADTRERLGRLAHTSRTNEQRRTRKPPPNPRGTSHH